MRRNIVANVGKLVGCHTKIYDLLLFRCVDENNSRTPRTILAENLSSSSNCSRAALKAESLRGGPNIVKKLAGRLRENACDSAASTGFSGCIMLVQHDKPHPKN
jgi:hypothetical protein